MPAKKTMVLVMSCNVKSYTVTERCIFSFSREFVVLSNRDTTKPTLEHFLIIQLSVVPNLCHQFHSGLQ